MAELALNLIVKDHIAFITLNRAVIDAEVSQNLKEAAAAINGTQDIYVAVITGAGKVFCNGASGDSAGSAAAVASIERPVIAAVNGDALGTGLEIALAVDIRLAADNARFALPQVKDGTLPGEGGTQRLPRIIGRGKALELLMTADAISAQQALEIGLVSKVVTSAELAAETRKLAETVAAKGPIALRYLKEAILKGMDMTLEQGLRLEADLYFLLHTTADRTEGIKSFLEKRSPKYQGK